LATKSGLEVSPDVMVLGDIFADVVILSEVSHDVMALSDLFVFQQTQCRKLDPYL
jgi:hypothetical protein